MSNSLKLSIVTPSFNQGEFIEQTIDSVLSQGYPNLEYFVMDGGSTDNSVQVIKKYEKYLTHWVSEPDGGQSHAINKGLEKCSGDIFNWINSDDYYEPGAFDKVNEAFRDEAISMACFTSKVFGLQTRISRGTDIFPENLPKAIAYSRIDQPETFFRMNAVQRMGPLDTELHYCMDKEWLLRYFLIFGNAGVIKSDIPVLNFRYHEDSKSVSVQEKFEVEADLIYVKLALQVNEMQIAMLIAELSEIDLALVKPSEYSFIEPQTKDDIKASLHYYLFKRYTECYEKLDKRRCELISDVLLESYLNNEDTEIFEKLSWRISRLPKSIIKLLRVASR